MPKDALPYPFDPQRYIGTVSELGPSTAKVNLPRAAIAEGQWHYGNRLGAGEVGEFVVVECGELGVIGRIIAVKLPERERLAVEVELGREREAHPIGTIQLLTTLRLDNSVVVGGVQQYPRLGSRVYAAHPMLLRRIAESSRGLNDSSVSILLGHVSSAPDHGIEFNPESLFGRHCAVLGATGGGKSWTIARLIEQVAKHNSKSILIDATGEFYTLQCGVKHVHLSASDDGLSKEVVIPYRHLTESDLLALFRPSLQAQAPKLRMAMKSLKVAEKAPTVATNGLVHKAGRSRAAFEAAWKSHAAFVEGSAADFDISNLANQILEECVFPSDFKNPANWGGAATSEQAFCVSLLTRIADMLQSSEMACILQPGVKPSLFTIIEEFLKSPDERVLRISMKYVPFAYNVREIVANAIGRYLLSRARANIFRDCPIVVFLDEAHQFLDRAIGDEVSRFNLDAFDLIAKEGRKFCLNICLATQRPRDVPEGVLSQMGSMIVHRLINDRDREIVERASGDIDRSAAAFLPTLAPGQAIIIGVEFPMPLTIQMERPVSPPDSKGSNFQKCWARSSAKAAAAERR